QRFDRSFAVAAESPQQCSAGAPEQAACRALDLPRPRLSEALSPVAEIRRVRYARSSVRALQPPQTLPAQPVPRHEVLHAQARVIPDPPARQAERKTQLDVLASRQLASRAARQERPKPAVEQLEVGVPAD